MKIEKGTFVRYKKQGICIISHIKSSLKDKDCTKVCLRQNIKVGFTSIDEIKKLKHSNNIIDLIEVGDYVNGMLVTDIKESANGDIYITYNDKEICIYKEIYDYRPEYIHEMKYDIKTIVTHEQFESMEYKIGEK